MCYCHNPSLPPYTTSATTSTARIFVDSHGGVAYVSDAQPDWGNYTVVPHEPTPRP